MVFDLDITRLRGLRPWLSRGRDRRHIATLSLLLCAAFVNLIYCCTEYNYLKLIAVRCSQRGRETAPQLFFLKAQPLKNEPTANIT